MEQADSRERRQRAYDRGQADEPQVMGVCDAVINSQHAKNTGVIKKLSGSAASLGGNAQKVVNGGAPMRTVAECDSGWRGSVRVVAVGAARAPALLLGRVEDGIVA